MEGDPLEEARVFARHERVQGAVLIVGVGNVGSLLAEILARLGISPLVLVDPEALDQENLVRSSVGNDNRDVNKATALAEKIRRETRLCAAEGIAADFLKLSPTSQWELVAAADVVVAAVDIEACRERVNEVCLQVERRAVYPAVWVHPEAHEGEISEILWTIPGNPRQGTPCYKCSVAFREELRSGGVSGATRADILPLVAATAETVRALLDPQVERSKFLDSDHTCMLIRSFMRPSAFAQRLFRGRNIRYIRTPFPEEPCPVCRSQAPPDPELEQRRQRTAEQEQAENDLREARLREAVRAAEVEQARLEAEAAREEAERARLEALRGLQGFSSLEAASASIDERRREAVQRRSQERAIQKRQTGLWEEASRQLKGISSTLKDSILSAGSSIRQRNLANEDPMIRARFDWEVSVGNGVLCLQNPHRLGPLSNEERRLGGRFSKEWRAKDGAPFDVIGSAALAVAGAPNTQQYVGRAHSLWFCDALERGRYLWYETAFFNAPKIYNYFFYRNNFGLPRDGVYMPLALGPTSPWNDFHRDRAGGAVGGRPVQT